MSEEPRGTQRNLSILCNKTVLSRKAFAHPLVKSMKRSLTEQWREMDAIDFAFCIQAKRLDESRTRTEL